MGDRLVFVAQCRAEFLREFPQAREQYDEWRRDGFVPGACAACKRRYGKGRPCPCGTIEG